MQKWILCLALLTALALPATGWAKRAVIDPNGRQLSTDTRTVVDAEPESEATPTSTDASVGAPAVPAESADTPGWLAPVYRFLGWIDVWYHPS